MLRYNGLYHSQSIARSQSAPCADRPCSEALQSQAIGQGYNSLERSSGRDCLCAHLALPPAEYAAAKHAQSLRTSQHGNQAVMGIDCALTRPDSELRKQHRPLCHRPTESWGQEVDKSWGKTGLNQMNSHRRIRRSCARIHVEDRAVGYRKSCRFCPRVNRKSRAESQRPSGVAIRQTDRQEGVELTVCHDCNTSNLSAQKVIFYE